MNFIDLANALTVPVVVVETVLIFAALLWRTARYVATGGAHNVPLLQWRDFLTFLTFVILVVGQQFARATGTQLSAQLWWVLLTDGLEIAVGAFWIGIEVGIIGRRHDGGER